MSVGIEGGYNKVQHAITLKEIYKQDEAKTIDLLQITSHEYFSLLKG